MRRLAIAGVIAAVLCAVPALAGGLAPLTDAEKCSVIAGDIVAYRARGRPCACPYSLTRAGAPCGTLSAWAKPGGAAPRCYLEDVADERVPDVRGSPIRRTWPQPPHCQPIS